MKAYEGVAAFIHAFLTWELVGGEWSASRTGRFTPEERDTGIHWIRGWVGPRTGPDDVEERKILPLRGLELHYTIVYSWHEFLHHLCPAEYMDSSN
jgi:hypothetical protein